MDTLTLSQALTIDAFALALCICIAFREARSTLHPAWMFLGLHVYIVTFRLIQLYTGSHPMRATFVWPVAVNEVIRAGVAADIGLVAMALSWVFARRLQKGKVAGRPELSTVSKFRAYLVAGLAMAIGIFGALTVGRLEHSLKNTSWDTSGYLAATTTWPSWSVCLLHFFFGFPVPLLIVTLVALAFVGIMNSTRFGVVIPIIFLTLTWLSRRSSRRFPFTLVAGVAVVWLLWLPMKPFTRMLKSGATIEEAWGEAFQHTYTQLENDEGSIDEQFLDMSAATMTLADIRGQWYWGGTITPLLVSPVPRVLWPDKPKINQYQWDIQVPSRNMAELGMTSGLVAEGYVNFGYFGVALFCFLVGFVYTWGYLKIARSHYLSPGRMLYFFCLAAASQVYRDGLISGIWFPLVYAAPIGWTAISHWIWRPGRKRVTTPVRQPMPEAAYVR
ncbi:MAG TPA: O-antigen polymerase [Bryobacteraceae bacterium]|nr:O-antigen polymerase [Bryobacteraceae bacterium]